MLQHIFSLVLVPLQSRGNTKSLSISNKILSLSLYMVLEQFCDRFSCYSSGMYIGLQLHRVPGSIPVHRQHAFQQTSEPMVSSYMNLWASLCVLMRGTVALLRCLLQTPLQI